MPGFLMLSSAVFCAVALGSCGSPARSISARSKTTTTTPTKLAEPATPPTTPPTTTVIASESFSQPGRLLQFASFESGWLVDPSRPARILSTTDGGRSWWTSYNGSVSSQNYDGAVKGLDFVNRSDGWALLYGEGLMGTQDGGHTWSAAAEPSQGPLETVTFTDPEIGWALTDQGTLLHTLDAGVNWLSVRTPASGLSLCANSSGTLWLGGNDGNIYESSSGASWNLAFSLSNVQAPAPALGDPQPGPWLTCTGDSAWALYQWGESAGSDPFVVERTLDDGENWMALVVPRGTGLVPPNPEVAMDTPSDLGSGGSTRAWVLGYCGPCGTGSASVVMTTGATSFSGTALPIATDTYASPIDAAFFGLEFGWVALREYPSSMAGSASVETTVIVATDDGGKTWHVVDPDVSR